MTRENLDEAPLALPLDSAQAHKQGWQIHFDCPLHRHLYSDPADPEQDKADFDGSCWELPDRYPDIHFAQPTNAQDCLTCTGEAEPCSHAVIRANAATPDLPTTIDDLALDYSESRSSPAHQSSLKKVPSSTGGSLNKRFNPDPPSPSSSSLATVKKARTDADLPVPTRSSRASHAFTLEEDLLLLNTLSDRLSSPEAEAPDSVSQRQLANDQLTQIRTRSERRSQALLAECAAMDERIKRAQKVNAGLRRRVAMR